MEQEKELPYEDAVGARGTRWLRSKYSAWILATISFAESLFAPIIIDPFLIAYIFAKRDAWKRYIAISVVFSVLGGVVAYILGAVFYDTIGKTILGWYNLSDDFGSVATSIDANGFVFVLLGALTPIPYKLVAIASGLLQMNFLTFLFASIVGRFLRLGLVGLAAHTAGPHALPLIRKNLLLFAYIIAAILITYIVLQIM